MLKDPISQSSTVASLIGARICHDLSNPVGAIGNGFELLLLSGVEMTPEMTLIEDSVNSVKARLGLFRMAFGPAASDQKTSRSELKLILSGLGASGRIDYHWHGADDPGRATVRLACLAMMCLEAAMPYGGTINVQLAKSCLIVSGSSERLKIDADLWASLRDSLPMVGLTPALVQFEVLRALSAESRCPVMQEVEPTRLTLRI